MEKPDETRITLGEKIRSARKSAGLTQGQLAEKLFVSRQAVTKWESGKGMPDLENLRQLSGLLDISIDSLLDGGEGIDLTVTRVRIDLEDYAYSRTIKGRWNKKAGQKDMAVRKMYPNAEIHALLARQVPARGEKITDAIIGCLTSAPFGVPEFLNGIKNAGKEFYLVSQAGKQFLVIAADEWIESRQLAQKITDRKFSIGNFLFVDCGIIRIP